jgi:hypothetical protein
MSYVDAGYVIALVVLTLYALLLLGRRRRLERAAARGGTGGEDTAGVIDATHRDPHRPLR